MGQTISQKILARASGRDTVTPGEIVWAKVDILMSHDPCTPGVASVFKKEFGAQAKVWDAGRFIMIPDHFVYSADPQANQNIRVMREFAKEQNITHFYDVGTPQYKGVCHIGLAEGGHTRPGEVLLGTDSHTVTAGAFGCFAIGLGITDAAYALGTGEIPLKVPTTIRVNYHGILPTHVQAKDLILALLAELTVEGATYEAIEFGGCVIDALSVEERMTICNMVVECGAKNGIMVPNQATLDYLAARTDVPFSLVTADADAVYSRVVDFDVTGMQPQVAKPHSPDNVVAIDTLKNVAISQAYIGSCTGGKLADFIAAAQVMKGRKVTIPTFAVPATKEVFHHLITTQIGGVSVYQILTDAGVQLSSEAGCAACCGGPPDTFGRVHQPISVIATTNRNFVGRMGHKRASIYLASPYAVAAAAITGMITNPAELGV
ncbi:3-isopropylmalate dehydratase large subunit [Erwinia persicina]|uniref:3-isopropylmalate dehydratase n=1 Tax=Erwinia persicina TaxID=55211 RepID=A0A3S7S7L7_9GAMM|nr:aconitase/3-isopropylmalate dehydratase large subunit family protein [Erwinia persicina]AXU96688.1 3-isopropylmalate dehydratase [Erwinia persicina]MBD8108076.1 3-isopropylmalate dehydratase large subunit [Erwinia persicina]MBD8211156.1 3-isopropylmalate dehydratase large subunit [Erwinia persicina]QZQ49871.1 3-isopropylmalate dehydratase large subunit [Erwinia persicina]TKJ86142.1 3-isopropylmalate dehydratase [Erwinia persicina]